MPLDDETVLFEVDDVELQAARPAKVVAAPAAAVVFRRSRRLSSMMQANKCPIGRPGLFARLSRFSDGLRQ